MWQSLHDAWWRLALTTHPQTRSDALLASALQGLSSIYRLVLGVRNGAYDRGWAQPVRLSSPVVSVGNLTVGGTGKTACVELLARTFQGWDTRVAILSRGYGGRRRGPYTLLQDGERLLLNSQPAPTQDGLPDEPQLLARRLPGVPVVVGRRREHTGAHACAQFGAQVLILDDGLHYRRLHRDCDVVLVNARMPLGGWALLPRGPMREPLQALRRAHIIVITKADQSLAVVAALQERLQAITPKAVVATSAHEPTDVSDELTHTALRLDHLAGRKVSVVSSIGDPEGFEDTVQRVGARVVAQERFPDHYAYHDAQWRVVMNRAAAAGAEAVVTTEKDAVRLRPFLQEGPGGLPVWVLRVQMRWLSGEDEVHARLARVCRR